MLRRKIDKYLQEWKNQEDRLPLIVKGARQIGKTMSVISFAKENYEHIINIDFALEHQYADIFDNGFDVDKIVRNITAHNPDLVFEPNNTLIFFD